VAMQERRQPRVRRPVRDCQRHMPPRGCLSTAGPFRRPLTAECRRAAAAGARDELLLQRARDELLLQRARDELLLQRARDELLSQRELSSQQGLLSRCFPSLNGVLLEQSAQDIPPAALLAGPAAEASWMPLAESPRIPPMHVNQGILANESAGANSAHRSAGAAELPPAQAPEDVPSPPVEELLRPCGHRRAPAL